MSEEVSVTCPPVSSRAPATKFATGATASVAFPEVTFTEEATPQTRSARDGAITVCASGFFAETRSLRITAC